MFPTGVAQVCYLYPEGRFELAASIEAYLTFLCVEQLLETVVLDLAKVLIFTFVLFLSLPSQFLLQILLLVLAEMIVFEFLLDLANLLG